MDWVYCWVVWIWRNWFDECVWLVELLFWLFDEFEYGKCRDNVIFEFVDRYLDYWVVVIYLLIWKIDFCVWIIIVVILGYVDYLVGIVFYLGRW